MSKALVRSIAHMFTVLPAIMTIDESTSSLDSMTTANTFLKAKLVLFSS